MMRYLILSLIFILVFSCGSYPKKQGFQISSTDKEIIINPYFSDSRKDYIYKAQIEVYGNSLGGLLIIKKLGDQHHRIAFTTEMGNKIFDFSFQEDNFKVNQILEDINKPMLINILKDDFSTLIKEQSTIEKSYTIENQLVHQTYFSNYSTFYFENENQLEKIIKTKHGKAKTIFWFQEINNHLATLITIEHKSIKLLINLKAIN